MKKPFSFIPSFLKKSVKVAGALKTVVDAVTGLSNLIERFFN
jgi:hypothetical protein